MQQEILNGYDENQTEVKRLRSQLLEVSEKKESELVDKKNTRTNVKRVQSFEIRIEELTIKLEEIT